MQLQLQLQNTNHLFDYKYKTDIEITCKIVTKRTSRMVFALKTVIL